MSATADEWIDFTRGGQMIAAIKSYRQSHSVGLAEAKAAVERWVAINMPPSPEFHRCCAICDRVADQLARYSSESGQALSWWINVLPPDSASVVCQQTFRYENVLVDEDEDRCDLIVTVMMSGVPPAIHKAMLRANLGSANRAVWLIDAELESVTIYRPHQPDEARMLLSGATLDGGDVLPGFTCPVADLFA